MLPVRGGGGSKVWADSLSVCAFRTQPASDGRRDQGEAAGLLEGRGGWMGSCKPDAGAQSGAESRLGDQASERTLMWMTEK